MASSTNNLFQKLTCVDFQLGLNFSSTIKIAFHFLNWLWLSFCCVLFFIQLFFFIIPQQKQSQSSSLTLIQQRVNVSLWPNIIFFASAEWWELHAFFSSQFYSLFVVCTLKKHFPIIKYLFQVKIHTRIRIYLILSIEWYEILFFFTQKNTIN